MTLYRQMKVADGDLQATRVALKVKGKWIDGVLLDNKGNILSLPHKVREGETYMIEVKG